MKDLLEQFNKTMAYLTKARDAYLSKKIHVSCDIMEKCRLKLNELMDKLESETLRICTLYTHIIAYYGNDLYIKKELLYEK